MASYDTLINETITAGSKTREQFVLVGPASVYVTDSAQLCSFKIYGAAVGDDGSSVGVSIGAVTPDASELLVYTVPEAVTFYGWVRVFNEDATTPSDVLVRAEVTAVGGGGGA